MTPLSIDLRTRIVARYAKGDLTYAEVAQLFDVGQASVSRLLRRDRERGSLEPDANGGGYPPRISDGELSRLAKLVAEKPDRTIAELCKVWFTEHGVKLSIASMGRSLQRAGLTRKKKSFTPTEQQRIDVQQKRETFLREVASVDPDDLVLLDESGCNIAMTSAYGRAPSGVRVADSKPANWGKNLTIVGAIKNDRVVCHTTNEGAMNKPRFIDFISNVLCPRLPRGAVVVLENLRAHHAPEVRQAIEAVGASVVYLPPYSPDLNPIELCWSFTKGWLRRLAERSVEGLRKAINNTILRVRTAHLEAWFQHCGFGQSNRSLL